MGQSSEVESPVRGDVIHAKRVALSDLARPTWAALNGISDTTLKKAEDSDPTVTPRSLRKIAKALGVHLSVIYDDAPDEMGGSAAGPPAWFVQYQDQVDARLAAMEQTQRELVRVIRKLTR